MKNRNIVKHSEKITKGRSTMNAAELRAFLATITTLKKEDTEFKEVVLTKQEFCDDTNTSLDYRDVKRVCSKLLKQTYEVEEIDPITNKRIWKGWTIYQRFQYDEIKNEVRFKFNDDMLPFLTQLTKNFTKLDFRNILNMTSRYSIRIYQFLKNLRNASRQPEWDLAEFQAELDVPKSHKGWGLFRKEILEKAQKEINELTDLDILGFFPEKKFRKKVISFSIKFAPKNEIEAIANFKHRGKREREIEYYELQKYVNKIFLDGDLFEIKIIKPSFYGDIDIICQYADKIKNDDEIYQYNFKDKNALETAIANAQTLLNHKEPSLFDD